MKTHLLRTWTLFCVLIFLTSYSIKAQVGIGTVTPDASSILDIHDSSGSKGLLIPKVALTATNLSAPVTPMPATSLLIYNTNTAGGGPTAVSPGYYYWDSSQWIPLVSSEKWDLLGNAGTSQSINFLGTTDEQGLTFRTNNTERFRIPNAFQVLAMNNGTSTLPFYTWNNDNDTGIFRIGNNTFGFSTNKIERLRLSANELVVNNSGNNYSFRIKSSAQENLFFVNGSSNKIGINTNDPQTELHVAGNSATVRIEELSHSNNIHNVIQDPAPVYVNNEGDLTLQPPLIQTFMPINDLNFLGTGVIVTSTTGDGIFTSLLDKSIILTQESLVHINYQLSVQITMPDGTSPIVDGASRLFRSFVSVNGSLNYVAVATGTYTNNPEVASPGGTYASGYYYLSGNGYVQLPAGTHSLNLSVLSFGGSFAYRMIYGETAIERFQVIVHR